MQYLKNFVLANKALLIFLVIPIFLIARVHLVQMAPDFTLLDQDNQLVTLSAFKGKKVALFFYPKNDSYYCTKEACSLRDGSALLKNHDIEILGISYDDPVHNKKFKEKYHLPYTLLSDSTKKISKLYGTYSWWTLGFFPKRKTFLINEQGIIVAILDDIDVEQHAQQIVNAY